MKFRKLQTYISFILLVCALFLSVIASFISYTTTEKRVLRENHQQIEALISAIKSTAEAALFSNNTELGNDAINGLLTSPSINKVELISSESGSESLKLSKEKRQSATLAPIVLIVNSVFDDEQLGELKVYPDKKWVQKQIQTSVISNIIYSTSTIFITCFFASYFIGLFISKPLVKVKEELNRQGNDKQKIINLPEHLKQNEIGVLVSDVNELVEFLQKSYDNEHKLNLEMEKVHQELKDAIQKAEDATEAKSEFLATISHEIRTPLTGILGMLSSSLENAELSPELKEDLEIAFNNAQSLLTLLNDILDFSKAEAGKLSIEKIPFTLDKEITACLKTFDAKIKEKKLNLESFIEASLPKCIVSDPTRIKQILMNFISNAIKFTQEGKITISVKPIENNKWLQFSVKDTGLGIPEETIPKLFQKYEQADSSTARNFGGTGLGLSICDYLVENLGGKITVESEVHVGSTFSFTIPLVEGEQINLLDIKPETLITPHKRVLNILCAEDIKTNQIILKKTLKKMGHKVSFANDGEEALKALSEQEYDLVLMDSHMPNMEGPEAIKLIRKGNWENFTIINPKILIVSLTADIGQDDHDKLLAVGANDVLTKPIEKDKLYLILDKFIIEQEME